MFKSLKIVLLTLFSSSVMFACGDSDAPEQKMAAPASDVTAVQLPAKVPDMPVTDTPPAAEAVYLPSKVVYQEEIYKNWPYTEAPPAAESDAMSVTDVIVEDAAEKTEQAATTIKEQAQGTVANVKAVAEEKVAAVKTVVEEKVAAVTATSSAKPYQLVNGEISANAMEGWKTYNGGGCGACHGKGGVGAVGPNLGNSVTTKLSKADFVDIVTNGKSGTMMRPHNTNKRVMDNMDNLYAYLVARGDGVLGPENLIKFPLGK